MEVRPARVVAEEGLQLVDGAELRTITGRGVGLGSEGCGQVVVVYLED